ncbi:MAG TPA: hypothetical protein VJZ00_21280, partial [Thermoanaerobaculia bacterium]|nr:hypothetical protein [Thermoanaerobaculia bacterium]
RRNERAAGLDFYIYFVAGQLAGRGDVDNIYSPETQSRIGDEYFERAQRSTSELRKYDAQRRRRLDNVSSPFLYTTLRWVSRDYERALRQDHVLVLCAFMAAVLLIARRVRLSWPAALFLLAALLLYYRGFEADLRVGNVNSLQLFAIATALWLPPILAGAVMAMLLLFKPNVIFVALLLFVAHDRKRLRLEAIGGAIGAVIAIVAAAISYGGLHVWVQWLTAANQFWHRIPTRMERNVTPALALFEQHGTWPSYAIAAVLCAIAVLAIRRGRTRDDVLIAGTGILIYLMSATVVWLHYMVLVIPVAIALMRWRVTAVIALLALLAIAEVPFEMMIGKPAAPVEAMLIAPALLELYVCTIWKLSDRNPAAARA